MNLMSNQIPLAELLQQQPNLSVTASPAPLAQPASPLADMDDAALARLYFQQQRPAAQPIPPELQFKYASLGLGALGIIGAMFIGWLHRPVQVAAHAQLTRDMGTALVMQQQQVEQAIATANPPQYKCSSLLGDCNFPKAPQQQPTLTAADLNQILQQQPAAPQPARSTFTAY